MKTIPLSRGLVALVDDEDYYQIADYGWYAIKCDSGLYYAQARVGDARVKMHVFILGARPGFQIDHKDGNGLNNQRANLRYATAAQNLANQKPRGGTSRYKGVRWVAKSRKWRADICVNRKRYHLGCHANEEDAARAYDWAARRFSGEFARLNFPETLAAAN